MGVSLLRVYSIIIEVGIALLVLNILLGIAGAVFDLAFDMDTSTDGILPFNITSLCVGITIAGIVGLYSMKFGQLISIIGSATIGLIANILLYKLVILKLRSSKPIALSTQDLVGVTGTTLLTATKSEYGTISVLDSTNAKITYKALVSKELTYDKVEQGSKVVIKAYDKQDKVCYIALI